MFFVNRNNGFKFRDPGHNLLVELFAKCLSVAEEFAVWAVEVSCMK